MDEPGAIGKTPMMAQDTPITTEAHEVPETREEREQRFSDLYSRPRSLENLPEDALAQIMVEVGRVCSTCLGLTCHKTYEIHCQVHGVVSLNEKYGSALGRSVKFGGCKAPFFTLGEMVNVWAGKKWVYKPIGYESFPTKFTPLTNNSYIVYRGAANLIIALSFEDRNKLLPFVEDDTEGTSDPETFVVPRVVNYLKRKRGYH